MTRLRITQTKSAVSREASQGRTLRALGLHRLGDSVEHEDKPEILGMINKVAHLVEVNHLKAGRAKKVPGEEDSE